MKKILSVPYSPKTIHLALLVTRVIIAVLMLTHGLPKLAMLLSGDQVQFPGVMGMSPVFSLSLAVFAEVVCSLLLLIGFGTRLASVPLIITMLIALFAIHLADPFAKQELAIHYLLVYVVLFLRGVNGRSLLWTRGFSHFTERTNTLNDYPKKLNSNQKHVFDL